MNPISYLRKHWLFYCLVLGMLPAAGVHAQICQNPTDTIYGMSLTGVIYPINVNNATIGTNLDSLTDGNAPINSNGIGYSKLNGRFYYFERSAAGSAFFQRFVYYDPATATVLGRAAPPFSNTSKSRSGCMNTAGNGYYTIDPAAAGGPTLYYFNALINSWTTITSVYKDAMGVDVSVNFVTLNSGDMAFDGNGNLWILISNALKYGLYKVSAPVPTTAVANLTVTQMISPATATPSGASVTGLAFNASGSLYLSTGTGDNKLYKMSSTSAALTLIGTLPKDGVASDLTSCSYPLAVLAVSGYLNFETVLRKDVELSWTSVEAVAVTGYIIQYSTDGAHWQPLATLTKTSGPNGGEASYHYTHDGFVRGNNFYRVLQLTADGKELYSTVELVSTAAGRNINIGPNPASDILYVRNYNNDGRYLAQVFDGAGRLLYYTILQPGQQSISIARFQRGSYVLRLTASGGGIPASFAFVKQ